MKGKNDKEYAGDLGTNRVRLRIAEYPNTDEKIEIDKLPTLFYVSDCLKKDADGFYYAFDLQPKYAVSYDKLTDATADKRFGIFV
jgi:hypothetical protein